MVVAAESVEGLHEDPGERARLLNAASTVVAHRLADPEHIAQRAGTIRGSERSHHLAPEGPTGEGGLRLEDTFRADPNEMRAMPRGLALLISAGRAANVGVARARTIAVAPATETGTGRSTPS